MTGWSEYLERILVQMELNESTKIKAREILELYTKHPNANRGSLTGMAAGAICVACKLENIMISHSKIAQFANLSPETVRIQYRKILSCGII